MSGLTITGFAIKPLDTILAEINAEQKATLGAAWNTEPDSVIGVINAISAAKLAELWEVLGGLYAAAYPESASGVPLDNVAAITGAVRLPATKSRVTVRCLGVNGTVLAIGRKLSTDPAGDIFVSVEAGTIGTPTSGQVDIVFEAQEYGPIIANTGTLTVIETPVSGWASASNLADAVVGRNVETDEAFRQRRIDLLEGSGDATLRAIRADVLDVPNVTECTVYDNTTDTTNADGMPPHSVEAIVRGGDDTAIRAALFDVVAGGILSFGDEGTIDYSAAAPVFVVGEIVTGTTSGATGKITKITGTTSGTFTLREVVGVFQNGEPLTGDVAGVATAATAFTYFVVADEEGNDHRVGFTRPEELVLEVNVTVLKDPESLLTNPTIQQLVKDALAAYGVATFRTGVDVLRNKLFAPIYALADILDVTTLEIRFNPPGGAYVTTSLAVTSRQLATLDTADIAVTVT